MSTTTSITYSIQCDTQAEYDAVLSWFVAAVDPVFVSASTADKKVTVTLSEVRDLAWWQAS